MMLLIAMQEMEEIIADVTIDENEKNNYYKNITIILNLLILFILQTQIIMKLGKNV